MLNKIYGIAILFFIGMTSCGHNHFVGHTGLPAEAGTEQHHNAHWSYDGEGSPSHWGELSPEFIKCAEGHSQSPIDIETYGAKDATGSILEFNYHPSSVDVVNNGHSIQANLEEENKLTVNGHDYSLKQFHFHEPSEHHLDGVAYPMEMHLVHVDNEGELAVVGVFIKEGKENKYLEEIWAKLPGHPDEHFHPAGRCDILHLLSDEKEAFHYSGSLTTPPCTEGVKWYVMKEPIIMSKNQIQRFGKIYNGNNRPLLDNGTNKEHAVQVYKNSFSNG